MRMSPLPASAMRVGLFGATGMIGSGVLIECLTHPAVSSVRVFGRRRCGVEHEKVTDIVHDDLFDLSTLGSAIEGLDVVFWCLGVSAAGLSEEEYDRITYQLTRSAADCLVAANPALTFCYVSAEGAASSEHSWMMWARVKGRIENYLFSLPLAGAYMLRPGYIQPVKGVRSRTRLYNALYAVAAPFYPILSRVVPTRLTTTEDIGLAMIRIASHGAADTILGAREINALAEADRASVA